MLKCCRSSRAKSWRKWSQSKVFNIGWKMERLEKYEKKLCFFLYGFFVVPKFSSLPTHTSKSTPPNKFFIFELVSQKLKVLCLPLPRISIELPCGIMQLNVSKCSTKIDSIFNRKKKSKLVSKRRNWNCLPFFYKSTKIFLIVKIETWPIIIE